MPQPSLECNFGNKRQARIPHSIKTDVEVKLKKKIMTWIKQHLWAVLGCLCSVLSLLTWHSYMTIHVKANHNATTLGRIGFNLDEIHTIAGVAAVVSLIVSGIGMYQNRQGKKATLEDIALILSIFAFLMSGTYL